MPTRERAIATTELLLILPAALFMTALVVRALQPLGSDPAGTADRIVQWYAERQWTLWILLIALPLAVLVTGCATLMPTLQGDARQTLAAIRAHPATLFIAAAAGVFLVIVILHVLAN